MTRRLFGAAALAAAVFLPGTTPAQGLAVKGGVSFNDVTANGALPGHPQNRTGYDIGVAIEPQGFLGLGVEGLFAQRGVNNSSATVSSRVQDYVDVPLYARLTIPIPAFHPYAFAGPQISFEIKCDDGATTCPDDGRNKHPTSAVIGAGTRLPLIGLAVEGRYVYGISDLSYSSLSSSSSYKSRTFLLLAAVHF